MRVLITGMSGTGKSAAVGELRRRGYAAYDVDDGFSEQPTCGSAWRWRVDAVSDLLTSAGDELVFFAGCSEEQALFDWDCRVLLTVAEPLLLDRLAARTSNSFGKSDDEQAQVLRDLRHVEPMLRQTANAVIDTDQPLAHVVDLILAATGQASVK